METGENSCCCGGAYGCGWQLGDERERVAMREKGKQCNEGEMKEPVNFVILIF